MPLDDWRARIASVRQLAENDIPQAYREAQRLQAATPSGAMPADRARMLNLLARAELHFGLIGQAAQHAGEASELARRHGDRAGQIEAGLILALAAINQGRLEDMAKATRDGVELLPGLESEDLRAEQMFQAAMMYIRFGHQEEAITVAVNSLDIARNGNDPRARVFAEYAMAVAYERGGLYEQAREHYLRMQDAARQARSTLMEGNALLGLSTIADHMGDVAGSERMCREAIALFRRAGGPFYAGHAKHVLASLYVAKRKPDRALPLFDENAAMYEQHDNPIGLWWTLSGRSTALQALGRLDAARRDAERANGLAGKIGFTVYRAGSMRRLSELAAAAGEFKRAYRMATEATALAAQAERENTGRRILDLSRRLQEEAKQREIDELKRNNERQEARQRVIQTWLAASIALLTLTIFFLLRLRKSREQIRALNTSLEQRVAERTAELEQNRHSLTEAQRIAHVGSWDLDLVSNKLTWSEESQRIFEIDPRQVSVTYEVFLNTIHPEDRDAVNRAYLSSLENRTPYAIEHRLLFPDGRIKYVHENCETFYDADGNPLRSIGTTQDITERKEMENALRESRELMAEAQRIARVGSWEYDIVNDAHTWSDELFRIYEIDPAKNGASYEGCMNATHPDDREAIAQAYLDSVETGQPYESEHRLLMADGRVKYVHERCEIVCGPDGALVRALGMMQDITERVLTEQRLKQALEFSEGVINAIPDLLFEVDCDGRYLNVWTHTPELLSTEKERLLGRTVNEVLTPDAAATVMEALHEAAESGASFGKVIRVGLPQGESWFELSASRKSGANPSVPSFLMLSRDVSERMRFEAAREAALAEAVRLAKQRSDFLSHVSHELRTPLNGILGYTQLLQRDKTLGERNADALNVVRQSGEHLLSLIDDILDLARIDAGRFQLDTGDIALPIFLRAVCDIVRVKAKGKGIEFDCELALGLPAGVRGDERRLRQVLLNLLSNAIKFTEQGKVTLRVGRAGASRLAFEVEDTGVGITANELESIFQPFEQAAELPRRTGGTGLGLSISRQLVRLMGGDIAVESHPGAGSIFRFELELPEADLASAGTGADSFAVHEAPADADEAGSFEPQAVPPPEEMQVLHRLALLGNMRDIVQRAGHIERLDSRYRPLAAHLRRLAEGYQSKAILTFIERHLNDNIA